MSANLRGWLLLVLVLVVVGCGVAGIVLWGQANDDATREATVTHVANALAGGSEPDPIADHSDSVLLFVVAGVALVGLVVLRAGAKKGAHPEG